MSNPKTIYKKGFVKTFKNGNCVTSVKDLKIDEEIEINYIDGKVKAKIIKVD